MKKSEKLVILGYISACLAGCDKLGNGNEVECDGYILSEFGSVAGG